MRTVPIAVFVAASAVVLGLGGPAGGAVAGTVSSARTDSAATTGTVVVRLAPVAGSPSLAGFGIRVASNSYGYSATTGPDGTATFTGVVTGDNPYRISIATVPDAGVDTVAMNAVDDVQPVTGGTTRVTLPLAIGGTVTGLLVDHTGRPLVGVPVTESAEDGYDFSSTTTDTTGRYTFHGLIGSRIVILTPARSSSSAQPTDRTQLQWEARSTEQTATAPASDVTVPTLLVHTDYDLGVGLSTDRTWEPISGATITARNTTTGATYDVRTPFTVAPGHYAQWDLPTGIYTLEVTTKVTPSHPVEHWWYRGAAAAPLSQDPADAGPVQVTFGGDTEVNGFIAR